MMRRIWGLPVRDTRAADFWAMYRFLTRTAHLMVGMPDYVTYVEHRRQHHPDEPIMTREQFFRQCQERRYSPGGGRGIRCC
jgi:uncharacterized short protein YbdD (DUF466 family)